KTIDAYNESDNPVKLTTLIRQGKQSEDTWAYRVQSELNRPGVLFFKRINGKIQKVEEEQSGYTVTTTSQKFNKCLELNLQADMNFKNMIKFVQQKSGANFPAAIQIFGATFMALHFKTIMDEYGFVPVPLVIGASGTTKSTMAKLALASIGVKGNKFDPTYSSLVNLVSKTQVPFLWEDAEDFNCLGKLVMLIYNDSEREKYEGSSESPHTMPVCTTNGTFFDSLPEGIRYNRFVQRTLLIPFNEYEHQKLGVIGKLMFSHTLTTEMGPKASALFPQFLELEEVIK
uniref:Uncharacterized protein n=2 Tax=Clytia hemisphaerica TaxID=252671 RepID=A0A7M5VBT3_9CNID